MVFFSSFFIITFDRLLLTDFSLELALLRLVSPRKCTSLLRLLPLVVLVEHSLLLWVVMMRLRWLFWEEMLLLPLVIRRMLLGCFVKPFPPLVLSHLERRFSLFYL